MVYSYLGVTKFDFNRLKSLKWTALYIVFLLGFGLLLPRYTKVVIAPEISPLILFFILVFIKAEQNINYEYLLKFFRYTFIACIVVYLSPLFASEMTYLFAKGIVFKEELPSISLFIKRTIPRNTGFVFDFRIMGGQLGSLYLLLLYYLGKKNNYFDLFLLLTITITTFSRGPILIMLLLLIAIYGPQRVKITKKSLGGVVMFLGLFMVSAGVYLYNYKSEVIKKYVATYNPFAENNAISQRVGFITYSMDYFYKNPFGQGLGYMSSSDAGHKIFTGYTRHQGRIIYKNYYYKVTDAYFAMSLAEKGIIGFMLFGLSLVEIFYSNRNRVSLFFLIGLIINLIGTDIPKQGFYYLTLILIYYSLSQNKTLFANQPKISA
ncbi:O-antigen ligase family protein [Algibacter lectus]|uniref:O-antigen ligase family protein n=1 Tax=Algibacter lectus TaxID=221126 RepID=UPI001D12D6C4|nr:O-antigen ligase family protein [Algibacter lectus]